ncbi:hypothetical protein FCK90_12915 [Kocuria coralli]|uniref:Uncharacterized protein n=1 Tax=Kocuria coralli TaxID=1461025 RepID=A0A5J5KUE5_9MICC|nr:hypothetical protein [Kocuria coralli]KAA9393283.1 hypothetical protein FCK90_12915 [Kocuria coralli]
MSKNSTLRTPLTLGLLALTASFGLAGCVPEGNGDPEPTETTQTETAETETAETETAETETQSAAPAETQTSEATSAAPTQSSTASSDKTGGSTSAPRSTATSGSQASSGDVDSTQLEGEPIATVEGKGGDTVEVPEHDGPIVVVFENTSSGPYTYIYGTADHGEVLDGVDTGETSINFVDPYSPYSQTNTKSYEIDGDSDETFTMSFYEVDAIPTAEPGETVTGEGFGVVKWEGDEDATVKASHDGEGNFIVHGEDTEPGGEGTQYTFNEIGTGYGYLDIGAGEYYIVVEADAGWTLEPSSPEEAEADSGTPAA